MCDASAMEFATDMAHELIDTIPKPFVDMLNDSETWRQVDVVIHGIAHALV